MMNAITKIILLSLVGAGLFTLGRFAGPPGGAQGEDVRPELGRLATTAAWYRFVDTVKAAGDAVIRTGDQAALDPRDAVERYNGLLTILSNTLRMPLNSDPARPLITTFDLLPALSKIGGNNPDADYHGFPVSHEFSYRLTGNRGKAPFFSIQVQSMTLDMATMRPNMQLSAVLSADQLDADDDGFFEVIISAQRPTDYRGPWLGMDNKAFRVVVREYHHDRELEGEPALKVALLGQQPVPGILSDEEVAKRLNQASFMSKFWFEARNWYPELRAAANLNRFTFDEPGGAARGDALALAADIQYMLGWWQLRDDQALVIEGRAPNSPYWVIQLADRWLETADFRSRQVHLNNSRLQLGPDGAYRVVLAARDPGVDNWLDTGGRSEGLMALRWAHSKAVEVPTTRVVNLSDL